MSKRQVIEGPSLGIKLKLQPLPSAPTVCPPCPPGGGGCTEALTIKGWFMGYDEGDEVWNPATRYYGP